MTFTTDFSDGNSNGLPHPEKNPDRSFPTAGAQSHVPIFDKAHCGRPFEAQRVKKKKRKLLRISSLTGFDLLEINQILYAEADGGVTHFFVLSGKRVTSSRRLCFYEELLQPYGFCRIHAKYLAQLRVLARFDGRERMVLLCDGTRLPVSQNRLKAFLEAVAAVAV